MIGVSRLIKLAAELTAARWESWIAPTPGAGFRLHTRPSLAGGARAVAAFNKAHRPK
jgi:hypothetical protein